MQPGQDNHKAKRFYVSGSVQGVGYRYFASRIAKRTGIVGYAKNLSDGRVEVFAIGTPEMLATLRRELERGPQSAVVLKVIEEDAAIEPEFEQGFSIERDAF